MKIEQAALQDSYIKQKATDKSASLVFLLIIALLNLSVSRLECAEASSRLISHQHAVRRTRNQRAAQFSFDSNASNNQSKHYASWSPSWASDQQQQQRDEPTILDQCCACDEAKYELVFEGLWSRYTHPEDFPENYWLAYFSDIIGASHSNDFRMWSLNSLASEGVRELAETGSTKRLESELKQVSAKTRTIIKARELRYPTLNSKTSAVFRTDRQHHLVSVLSKLAPSPDWMLGVSGLELCQLDCTWAQQRVVNLHLLDAGTDSGTTFTASDLATRPQERIHYFHKAQAMKDSKLASHQMQRVASNNQPSGSHVNAVGSPTVLVSDSHMISDTIQYQDTSSFNAQIPGASMTTSEQLKPFARLTITRQRIYEKSCQSEPAVINTNNSNFGSKIYDKQSPTKVDNMDEYKPADYVASSPTIQPSSSLDCRFSEWSDWSMCSSQCGKGIRTRTRSFLAAADDQQAQLVSAGCARGDLIEKEICLSECTANGTCITRDWSEWSKCSVNCGQGYRKRLRSPIGKQQHAACDSVELAELEQCTGPCTTPNDEPSDITDSTSTSSDMLSTESKRQSCQVTDWSQWSECSVACGRGTKIRVRQLVHREDADSCQLRLIQKQPCMGKSPSCNKLADEACSLEPKPGACSATLNRWYYNSSTGKCQQFIYTGCLGNKNNFRNIHECYKVCVETRQQTVSKSSNETTFLIADLWGSQHNNPNNHSLAHNSNRLKATYGISNPDLPVIDCKLSNWGPWSTCSALCGQGKRTRSRYIIQMPQNGGKPCDKKLTRTQRCKGLSPCPPVTNHNLNNNNRFGTSKNHIHNHHSGHHGLTLRTTTTSTTTIAPQSSSMMDDEDDSKFSKLLRSDTGHFQLAADPIGLLTESYFMDGQANDYNQSPSDRQIIGSSNFQIRNGYVYSSLLNNHSDLNQR